MGVIHFLGQDGDPKNESTLNQDESENLSECRYNVIDILLDHLGFSSQKWIAEIELTKTMSELHNVIMDLMSQAELLDDRKIRSKIFFAAKLRQQ